MSDLTTNDAPGYTASFDLLAGLGSTSAQQAIQFNNVSQAFRITDGNATDQIVSNSLFLVVERGNSVISHITTTDLKFEPWVGAGPQRGTSSAPSKPGPAGRVRRAGRARLEPRHQPVRRRSGQPVDRAADAMTRPPPA